MPSNDVEMNFSMVLGTPQAISEKVKVLHQPSSSYSNFLGEPFVTDPTSPIRVVVVGVRVDSD
jgi:hypothetical protein